ncbi:MAG TPA: SpoIIE family protein phosphatase [Thermoanaerobaculia bacterium]|nr:SpoIIE family protein phosphatase [Thermoanaerobaculia bacterium]
MGGPDRRMRLLGLGAVGVAVFAIGVFVALRQLPEWRNLSIPEESFFAARLQQIAGPADLRLESLPHVQLRSNGILLESDLLSARETAYDVLGPSAADWLAREGRGPFVDATAQTRWAGGSERGQLRVVFSVRGVPISAIWIPEELLRSRPSASSAHLELDRMFLPPGQTVPTTELTVLTETLRLAAMPASAPPEVLITTSIRGADAPTARRVVGTVGAQRGRLENLTFGSFLTARMESLIVRAIFWIAVLVLFGLLLIRRRIELKKGLVLGALSIALSLPGALGNSASWILVVQDLGTVTSKALALFFLWSAAESWLRSTVPGFRTSLDTLRAGRLGPKGGTALLAGWSIGASVAGLWLLAMSFGTMVPGVATNDGSIRMPFFGVATSPIEEGAFRTGLIMLVVCIALRWPLLRRIRGGATLLGGLVLATRIPLSSFGIAFTAGLLLTAILVYAYAEFGLTALLTAAMMSAVLPAALYSLLHFYWVPLASVLLLTVAIAPVPLGLLGIRRDDEAEEGPLPLPDFARRLEEENRLKYEMDLLARMQLGLLPKEMPQIEGYEIVASSILASEAGGDLYDFVRDSAGRLWIAAGDVSGHGYSCAIAQAMTKAGLASLVEAERTPAMVLQRLDLVLREIGSPRTFTSLALLRLDPITGEALVSNAGHPYPWIVRGTDVRELDLPSLPLGLGPAREYTDTPLSIPTGTTIVIFSDGLFEAHDTHARPYGFDRLREILGKVSRRPASAILTAILEDWRRHAGPATPADDTTVVAVKRT